jgi:hypothetical protein
MELAVDEEEPIALFFGNPFSFSLALSCMCVTIAPLDSASG